jgi:ssRNA-specific RNase YbeY (16S rRNA maturation enzyme)
MCFLFLSFQMCQETYKTTDHAYLNDIILGTEGVHVEDKHESRTPLNNCSLTCHYSLHLLCLLWL